MSARDDVAGTGVVESCRWVVARARYVEVDAPSVELVADRFAADASTLPSWHSRWHFFDNTERSALAILALDAVNFCFWGDDEETRWRVRVEGEQLQGYWACAACCKRAIETGQRLFDPGYLATMTLADAERLFAGDALEGDPIPLLPQRLEALRELGRVLLERYGGRVGNLLDAAGWSAPRLTLLLARDFSSFDDVATYEDRPIRFYKRAQIYAADLHGAFGGESFGALRDMDALTAFADYKVPQVLRRYGVLTYAPELSDAIDRKLPIVAGDPREIEIRAATVCAVEDLRRALRRLGLERIATEIDWRLWLLGQEPHPDDRPYHRTRTIFY